MPRIARVKGRRVWDSRARPTVEAEVVLDDGTTGRAIAPAGASMGSGEATDLRDGGTRLGGFDVMIAVANVSGEIHAALQGREVGEQGEIDDILIGLDGTSNMSRLGGNATIAVSMAALHAAANASGEPLFHYLAGEGPISIPLPEIQIFGGGAHAGRRVDVQDFLVMCPSATSVAEALERTAEVYLSAGRLLAEMGSSQGVADEGGWWPAFDSNEQALDLLVQSIEWAGYTPGQDVYISLDIAASELGKEGQYRFGLEEKSYDSDGLCEVLLRWIEKYPILSIEDPLGEDDERGFRAFMAAVGDRVQVVGDDLLVTSAERVDHAHREGLANCVLVKPNQAGTISRTKAAMQAAREKGFGMIVSARSGESEDITIAHLATGWNAGQIKVGSIARGERTAKWNELLRLEEALQGRASFAGWQGLRIGAPAPRERAGAHVGSAREVFQGPAQSTVC